MKKIIKEVIIDELIKSRKTLIPVIPAQTGIQEFHSVTKPWIPAFAGMTTFYISIINGFHCICAMYLLLVCLAAALPGKALAGVPDAEKMDKVCRYVMEHANEGRLDKILIKSEPLDSSRIPLTKEMGEIGGGGVEFRQLIDVNNDGKKERVFIDVQGTAHEPSLLIYQLHEDQAIDIRTDKPDDEQPDLGYSSFLRFQKATYMLLHNGLTLYSLNYLDPSNNLKTVCNFRQKKRPFSRIKKSADDELCNRFLKAAPDPLHYTKVHSLTRNGLVSAGIYETAPGEKAALADIGNDGVERLVVLMELASGRGAGCSVIYPAVLTPDRSSIEKNYLEMSQESSCGEKIIPFIHNSKTYLGTSEYGREDGRDYPLRKIEILERGALGTVCEYEVRPVNYLLTPEMELIQTAGEHHVTPWQEAIRRPGTDAVRLLIGSGRDLNEKGPEHGELPLNEAIFAERFDILEMLLEAGADPNLRDETHTPLGMAVWQGYPRAVTLLLKYGADASDESHGDDTAISSAVFYDRLDFLRMLLDYGSAITDLVAIEVATSVADDHHIEKLKLLLEHGLDVNGQYARYVFAEGIKQEAPGVITVGPDIRLKLVSKTLMEWARVGGDAETIKLLEEARNKKPRGGLIQKLRKADSDMSRAYKLLAESLEANERPFLKKEQMNWQRKLDGKCGSGFADKFRIEWLKNAASNEKRGECVLNMTDQRAAQLQRRLSPGLFLPDETVAGRSQEEWSREFWRWSRSFPKGKRPAEEGTGSLCSQKQPGNIWLLAGSSTSEPVQRKCEIPHGLPVLLPVLTSLAEAKGKGEQKCNEMQGMLNAMVKSGKDLKVEIDGKEVPDITKWRQTTDCFPLMTIEGERFAASDGYWIVLKPLTPGRHDIHIKGRFEQDGFSQDVRYELTVR